MKRINTEYDVGAAFEAIEEELISSMIRNMERHKLEEIEEEEKEIFSAEFKEEISKLIPFSPVFINEIV